MTEMQAERGSSRLRRREKMAVAVPQHARWAGKAERWEGPASYRSLGLCHAVAGSPSAPPWPPTAAVGTGLVSGPLAPAFIGPYN